MAKKSQNDSVKRSKKGKVVLPNTRIWDVMVMKSETYCTTGQ